ncbi:hypothetical protein C943_01319 [Mariniradius saccharolyticus AK6]|uniref:Uncharacterized protein n=1 Tax=Mariniradius saccharolyticus AK6 TaxID=1239962 RepID=M7XVS0_9BACT|nr:hypothetical protein [Mariniradius saccharolyticus]EMS32592.1 hypothetical protein C943_01319 [Mariniradius saccharolyticus AK6]
MGALHFLDLVIGLAFIYFLLSIICLSLQEFKANFFNERSKNLEKWIKDTFNNKGETDSGPGLGDRLWKNIMIDGLTQSGRTVSYIPKEVFVSALLDEIYYGSDDSKPDDCLEVTKQRDMVMDNGFKETYDFNSLKDAIERPSVCLPKPFQRVIRQVYAESHENLETFRMRLERWFEMAMVRNSGTYKKKAQWWTFGFAILVTIGINVDSVQLASHLYDSPDESKRIADKAEVYFSQNQSLMVGEKKEIEETVKTIQADIKRIKDLKLPIGRENFELNPKSIPGWIITIFAVSLGAPFWFDTLNKLVNLRAAGKMPNGVSSISSEAEKRAKRLDNPME